MKKLFTLVLLCMAVFATGQKALSGALVIQDNVIEFQNTVDTAGLQVTNHFKPVQFPTFSFSYLKYLVKGGYHRYFASGWRYTKIKDFDTAIINNGLTTTAGGEANFLSARLGYARGMTLLTRNQYRLLFLEGEFSAGFQHARYQPFSFNQYARTIWAAYARLGVNLVLQKSYEKGFLNFKLMLSVLQVNSEHYRIQNSFYPSLVNETNSTYLSSEARQHSGLELGGGVFLNR